MKTSERHHLKDNELADIAATAGSFVQDRGKPIVIAVVAVVVVLAAVGGYLSWKGRAESQAHTALAAAQTEVERLYTRWTELEEKRAQAMQPS